MHFPEVKQILKACKFVEMHVWTMIVDSLHPRYECRGTELGPKYKSEARLKPKPDPYNTRIKYLWTRRKQNSLSEC